MELGFIALIVLLLLGLVLTFFGRKIMETFAFIIGAIAGAMLALWLAPLLVDYVVSDPNQQNICIIIAVIVGAIIGGFLGRSLMYGMISFLVATIISGIVFAITFNEVFALIAFFITLIIMWFLVQKFLAVMTAFLGGCMVGLIVMYLTSSFGPGISLIIFVLIAALLTIAGARYQLKDS